MREASRAVPADFEGSQDRHSKSGSVGVGRVWARQGGGGSRHLEDVEHGGGEPVIEVCISVEVACQDEGWGRAGRRVGWGRGRAGRGWAGRLGGWQGRGGMKWWAETFG
jgi:hypothetical protein